MGKNQPRYNTTTNATPSDELDRKLQASSQDSCNEILRKIMTQMKLDYSAVKEDISIIWARGLARFDCELCNKRWISRYAWIEVDLLHVDVRHLYKQRCFGCWKYYRKRNDFERFEAFFTCSPKFLYFRHVMRNVIKKYYSLLRRESEIRPIRKIERRSPPHSTFCCEACEYGMRKCWQRGPQGSVGGRVVFKPDIPHDPDDWCNVDHTTE